jgi:biotin carboxyl carrier protein
VNDKNTVVVEQTNGQDWINSKLIEADWCKTETGYHAIINGQSISISLLPSDDAKTRVMYLNGKKYNTQLSDDMDLLLHKLGMDTAVSVKANVVKAPMPGMVLKIMVNEGDTVKKGDGLIVLEAMKMENIIKSAVDGIIKKIAIQVKQAVDKNQELIFFE